VVIDPRSRPVIPVCIIHGIAEGYPVVAILGVVESGCSNGLKHAMKISFVRAPTPSPHPG
jgi:hypothetical protein